MISDITPQMPQFWFLFAISICILLCKSLISYLSFSSHRATSSIHGDRKVIDLRFGLFLMCSSLLIARVFWTYLDFHLTQFNTHEIYATWLNALVFKAATIFVGLGFASFVWAVEKNELNGKLHGLPSIGLVLLLSAIVLFPLGSLADFRLMTKLQLSMNLIGLFIPAVFIFKAFRCSPSQRERKRWYMGGAVGVMVYAAGANLLNESIMMALRSSFGDFALYLSYTLLLVFKATGLALLFVAVLSLDKAQLAQPDLITADHQPLAHGRRRRFPHQGF